MNKNILNYIEECEAWKVGIKNLHWSADNLSQHELCDDIADEISNFEDLVSEVEQSISGKIKLNGFTPKSYKITSLKSFVEDVISASQSFLKELEGMDEKYVGIKSECETFIGTMQRKLYLVNFTLKEELKKRLRDRINESRPKNLANTEDVEKFMGRRPKTIKARINQIYRIVKKYGIDSRKYHDEAWQAIDDYYRAITSLGCEVELKPCGHLNNADSMESDGGYCDYDPYDHMPRSKQYAIKIMFDDGMNIEGYIKCMAAGTVEDPFASYDTCMVLWPKQNNVLEAKNMSKQMRLTEAELKQVVKEAAIKILSETPLNYDIDNFSGRWTKPNNWNVPNTDLTSGEEYFDDEGYLDDPYKKNEIEDALKDDEWEWGKDMDLKGAENYYSWDRFDGKPIAQGLDPYYKVGKGAVGREVDDAISRSNRENDWSDRELMNGYRMMDKWVNGKRDTDDIGDAWDDIHYESKKPMKVTEAELKQIVKEAAINLISEYTQKQANTKGFIRSTHGHRKGYKRQATPEERAEARRRLGIPEPEKVEEESIDIDPKNKGKFTATKKATGKSTEELTHSKNPLTRKRANFAKMAKRHWKPLKEGEGIDDGMEFFRSEFPNGKQGDIDYSWHMNDLNRHIDKDIDSKYSDKESRNHPYSEYFDSSAPYNMDRLHTLNRLDKRDSFGNFYPDDHAYYSDGSAFPSADFADGNDFYKYKK